MLTIRDRQSIFNPIPRGPNLPEETAHDNLTKIRGIGKVIQNLLNRHGISSFAQLAQKTEQELVDMLEKAQGGLGVTHPDTWIEQARMLAERKKKD